jgi:hypothetical protein
MKMTRVAFSARDYKLVSSFETVRETLLQDRYSDRLSKPLAYWALPNDRRLPLAFLNRSIGDLLNTPFEDLSATPGIGQKKIGSLVRLLLRATKDEPPAVPFGLTELSEEHGRLDPPHDLARNGFDAYLVSEALWSEWARSVRQFNLGEEKLGRIAESLRTMPTVIWNKPLSFYQDLTLAQIRTLRTHGEKRVRCVLQVFHKAHEACLRWSDDAQIRDHLGSPRIRAVSEWIKEKLASDVPISREEFHDGLADPILRQIEIDCGHTVHRIARQRLGIDGEPMSVRSQAQMMGVTRARVYQLLDDCHRIIEVRWPHGNQQLDRLTAKLGSELGDEPCDYSLFLAARQLCFPDRSQIED